MKVRTSGRFGPPIVLQASGQERRGHAHERQRPQAQSAFQQGPARRVQQALADYFVDMGVGGNIGIEIVVVMGHGRFSVLESTKLCTTTVTAALTAHYTAVTPMKIYSFPRKRGKEKLGSVQRHE